ncbi:MAG: hypothetical protein HY691_09130 [Chloroflexi bacterium]|nr:hypothetical protein [Chloroflexota bacterium]
MSLATAPRGRFGALLLAAMWRRGILPLELQPVTPAAWIDVLPLPTMRTFPIVDRRQIDTRL